MMVKKLSLMFFMSLVAISFNQIQCADDTAIKITTDTKLQPISLYASKIIQKIYELHGMSKKAARLHFCVFNDEKMLPESAFDSKGTVTTGSEGGSYAISAYDNQNRECVFLSPCLNKIIESSSYDQFYGLKTSSYLIFMLLKTIKEFQVHSKLSQITLSQEQLNTYPSKFALQKMRTNNLIDFAENLEQSYLETSPHFANLLDLTRQELNKRNNS